MSGIAHRPFFSIGVLVIAAVVILLGVLVSGGLVAIIHRLLFE